MVVRLSAQDGLRPIELFYSEESNHLVAKRQVRSSASFSLALALTRGKSVGPSNDQMRGADAPVVAVFHPLCQLNAAGLFAVFIEKNDMVGVVQGLHENGCFCRFS